MYEEHLDAVCHNLDALHWDPAEAAYCDTTTTTGDGTGDAGGEFRRVCRLGYVSLYPLLLGLMGPDHPHLPAVLDLLSDPARLWSPHGLRSLSAADPGYGRDENYWRGAVWMNLNALAVLRLRDLGARDGPERARAHSLAAQLRQNVVGTVYDGWVRTGLFWEQYSDRTGEGRRSRAFTGWTACVILLLGLDLGEAQEGAGAGTSSPVGWISITAVASLFIALALIMLCRRGLTGLFSRAMNFWRMRGRGRGRNRNRSRRGGYEEVIDLDERESLP